MIADRAAVSVPAAALLVGPACRQRRPTVPISAAFGTLPGAVAGNATLHATRADQFSPDAPIPVFPISCALLVDSYPY